MKAEEKKLIYDLLKNASANTLGYTSDFYKTELVFTDDIEKTDEIPAEETQSTKMYSTLKNQSVLDNAQQTVPSESSAVQTSNQNESSHKISLQEISSKIARCTRCQLARTRNNVVPGTGVEHPDVLVVGEGPGYDEDMQGLPFVGKAGKLLDKMLNAIELDRNKNCYIANIVKCRPPQNRDPLPEEESACFSFLEAQIHILKPKMILCMGRVAGHKLLDTQAPLKDMRGLFFEYNKIPVMVTYHPSALLRDESLKRPAWEDLKKFRAELNKLI